MKPSAVTTDAPARTRPPGPILDTGLLGLGLRRVYEGSVDTQPITDAQVELLLRLRQKERDLRRPA